MRNNVFRKLYKYLHPSRLYILLSIVFALVSVSLSLLTPIFIGRAIDSMLLPGSSGEVLKYIAYIAASSIASSAASWLMTLYTNKVSYKTVQLLRREAFSKLSRLPLKHIDGTAHGDMMSRVVGDIVTISDGLIQGFSQFLVGIITILGTIFFMLSQNVLTALVVIVLTPVSLVVAAAIAKAIQGSFKKRSEITGELTAYINENIGELKLIKTFSYEERSCKGFDDINEELNIHGFKAQFFSALINPSTRFVNGLVYAAAGIFGALSAVGAIGTPMSLGGLSSFLSYANQYTKPFNEISGVIAELQGAISSAGRVFALIEEKEESPDFIESRKHEKCKGEISFENVSFSYNKDRPFIEDFNLFAKPGEKIAIVGPTGCGKTTIINLLMRFYEINGGRILLDGKDIREFSRKELRENFGMVLQETWLLSDSVRANIAYGKENASEADIITAAMAAHAHSFIKRLPMGYDTVISENGSSLSEGERQLLSIARVMLRSPSVLILDEATSSIDTRTELAIQRAFDEMTEGRTSFIVAHRLSTIVSADKIIAMKDGRIIESGTHEELLKKNAFYAKLYMSQFAGKAL